MKKFFTVTAILLLLAGGNHLNAQTRTVASVENENKASANAEMAASSKTEQELNKISKEVVNAILHADKKVLEHYLANNYFHTSSNGQVITKAQLLSSVQPYPAGTTWEIEDVKVKDYGNTVVESSKNIHSFEGNNQKVTTMDRFTLIFMQQQGQWKIIASHSSDIPADRMVAKIDPAIYSDYVGQYQIGPTAFLTLTQKGDKLMGKATGNSASFEFLPESEIAFFIKNQQDRITFVKDDKGQISYILHHYADGQDVKEVKIK